MTRCMHAVRTLLPGALAFLGAAAAAQDKPEAPSPGAPTQIAQFCAQAAAKDDPFSLAQRARCVLIGVAPSERRVDDARDLARRSLRAGEPLGGFMLYQVYVSDPQYRYLRDGKADMEAYNRLAATPVSARTDQIEALEGLGFALGKWNRDAFNGVMLYLYDTTAPRNVDRLRTVTTLLAGNGLSNPVVQRLGAQAQQVLQVAPATKVSLRTFADISTSLAGAVALAKAGGKTACANPRIKSVSSGDIVGAEYLPLTQPVVRDSYLVRGEWTERWVVDACGSDLPFDVAFKADGWGGATFQIAAPAAEAAAKP